MMRIKIWYLGAVLRFFYTVAVKNCHNKKKNVQKSNKQPEKTLHFFASKQQTAGEGFREASHIWSTSHHESRCWVKTLSLCWWCSYYSAGKFYQQKSCQWVFNTVCRSSGSELMMEFIKASSLSKTPSFTCSCCRRALIWKTRFLS